MIERAFEVVYVSQWRRLGALLLDLFLYLIFFVPVTFALLLISFEQRTIIYFTLYLVLLLAFFQVYLTMHLGGSVGKLTFNIKVVTRQKKYASIFRAIIRTLPFIIITIYLISFLSYMLHNLPGNQYPTTIAEAYYALIYFGNGFFDEVGLAIIGGVLMADHIVVFATPGKQTLHDVLAGTYTITRDSYYASQYKKPPYLHNIIGQVINLRNYRQNSILEKLLPQKALIKTLFTSNKSQQSFFVAILENEIKIEGREIASDHFIIQLQSEHTTLQTGRNQVVYFLAVPAGLNTDNICDVEESKLQFIDFVMVD